MQFHSALQLTGMVMVSYPILVMKSSGSGESNS